MTKKRLLNIFFFYNDKTNKPTNPQLKIITELSLIFGVVSRFTMLTKSLK